ncbi:ATP-binding protein [Kiloniella spongiae]|uniref:ATP-binding protein n=1 Tax=Kiloniella spongiae TaxID=1489064 RepID=UPI00069B4681|nr:ATP-binding protein [Kiloniella spongiae]
MLDFLKSVHITTKVFGGFGITLFLLLITGTISSINVNNDNINFKRYRSIALQTNQAGRVQANLLEARLAVKNFIIDASSKNATQVRERANKALDLNSTFHDLIQDKSRLSIVDSADQNLRSYLLAFEQVLDLQNKRNKLVINSLDVIGPQIEQKLASIMENASENKNILTAIRMNDIQRNLLLLRLYAYKFLVTNDQNEYDRAISESLQMRRNIAQITNNTQDATQQAITTSLSQLASQYRTSLIAVHDIIIQRNSIISGILDQIGPRVATEMENLKLSIKSEQDILGPKATIASDYALWSTLVITVTGLIVGTISAWAIGSRITRPVQEITNSMGTLAAGNCNIDIPGQGHKDEIGQMAAAVQVFKESMIKNKQLIEKEKTEEKRILFQEAEIARKEMEVARIRQNRAEASNKLKDEFLANMSHEIRTPMNGICGMAQLLNTTQLDDEQKSYTDIILSSCNNLSSIISDMLDLSKIESGNMELNNAPFNLKSVIEQAVSTVEPVLQEKKLKHRIIIKQEHDGRYIGDFLRIKQILVSILSNAVKFTDDGHIDITAEYVNKNVVICVKDTGCGIPNEIQGKIFERFYQADSSSIREYGGVGIGLSITKGTVDLMGGTIELNSQIDIGTDFTITLPLRKISENENTKKITSQPSEQLNGKSALVSGQIFNNILVAEDNPINQRLLTDILVQQDKRVTIANNGQEAIEALEKTTFDLVLMDIQMPIMNGDEAIKIIRASDQPFKDIPIFVITADAMSGAEKKYLDMGANKYISKPIKINELIKLIT